MPAVGERWAYRARATHPLVAVEVLAIGTARPPRVRVRFIDDSFEGREEWTPPGRLKAPWADAERWARREARWDAAQAESREVERTPEYWAVSWSLAEFPEDVVEFDRSASEIRDVDRLLDALGVDRGFLDDERSFVDHESGALVVPWPVTLRIAQAAAPLHAAALLAQVDEDEAKARHDATYGRHYDDRRGGWSVSAENCAQLDREHYAPARALLREWCGAPARTVHDELVALRAEVRRLGRLLERAALALHDAGETRAARELEDELGVPVETLKKRRR